MVCYFFRLLLFTYKEKNYNITIEYYMLHLFILLHVVVLLNSVVSDNIILYKHIIGKNY